MMWRAKRRNLYVGISLTIFFVLTLTVIGLAQATEKTLTNREVVDMHKNGLSAAIIEAKINATNCIFDTSVDALKELKTAGVPDAVVLAMIKAPVNVPLDPKATELAELNAKLNGAYLSKDVTVTAVILSKPSPKYTKRARKNGVEGFVRLQAVLSASGEVKNILPIHTLPDGLTEKSIEAAKRIKFRPAEKDGKPVSLLVYLDCDFRID